MEKSFKFVFKTHNHFDILLNYTTILLQYALSELIEIRFHGLKI